MKPPLRLESRLALLIGLFFGLAAVVFVPPAVTFDGPSHYLRALQVSRGQMRAERYSEKAFGGRLPQSHADFVNTLLWDYYWRSPASFMNREQWQSLSQQQSAQTGTRPVEFTNTAIYSPLNYAFQAVGMGLAARLSPSPLLASRLGCLMNLAGFLFLVIAALEAAPLFQRGILLLASSPLMVVQAASLSADAINFALPLLLLCGVWRLRVSPPARPRWELAWVLALALLTALLKPTLVALVPCLLLIPGRAFGRPLAKAAVLAAVFVLAGALWWTWNRPYLEVDVARWFEPGRPAMSLQVRAFLGHPSGFLGPLGFLLSHQVASQWPHLYGDPGGWIAGGVFTLNTVLSLVFLAGFLGCAEWSAPANRTWAAGMAALGLGLLGVTSLALWLSFGTPDMAYIPGFVGRYMAVPTLMLGVAWAEMLHHGAGSLRHLLFRAALCANAVGLGALLLPVAARTW